jgi:hypothetical protein
MNVLKFTVHNGIPYYRFHENFRRSNSIVLTDRFEACALQAVATESVVVTSTFTTRCIVREIDHVYVASESTTPRKIRSD